ncbi:hypothetical protein [Pseudoclavibacter chungangensis]|nr:hypothetical protein [Pseudoclavibacter chungangensis]
MADDGGEPAGRMPRDEPGAEGEPDAEVASDIPDERGDDERETSA